jgi:hypothetical protein
MDDAKIQQLTEEVLSQLQGGAGATEPADLESRVAALEAAVRALHAGTAPASTTVVVAQTVAPPAAHPASGLLGPSGGGKGACILEPDKPCVGSGQCRSFGH